MSPNDVPHNTGGYLVFGQKPVNWTKRLEWIASSRIRQQGLTYFNGGRVQILSGSRERVEASVIGSQRYSVKIEVTGSSLALLCSCPYFGEAGMCKHIWAALIAAERRGHLGKIGEIDPSIETLHGNRRPGAAPRRAPPPKPEPWKEHLAFLQSHAKPASIPAGGERRLMFIAEPSESINSNGLPIRAFCLGRKKNGDWGKPNWHERYLRDSHLLDGEDQRLVALLSGAKDIYSYYGPSTQSEYRVHPAAYTTLLPLLCATGRFVLASQHLNLHERPALCWDDGPPWKFRVSIQRNDDQRCYDIHGELLRGEEVVPINKPPLISAGLVFFQNSVCRFEDGGALDWAALLRRIGMTSVPYGSRHEFMMQMSALPAMPPLEGPEELRIETRALDRAPVLKIRQAENPNRAQSRLRADLYFDYAGEIVSGKTTMSALHDKTLNCFFRRDRAAEAAAANKLGAYGFYRADAWMNHGWELPPAKFPSAVRGLIAEGWRVEAEGKLYRRAGSVRIEVRSGIDWFDVQGGADFEGEPVAMPELLKAIARGDNMVRLGDGSYGVIPEQWLHRYQLLAGSGRTEDGNIRFARNQAGLLDALLAGEPEASFDEGFLRIRKQLGEFDGLRPADPPPAFQGALRGYQREGLGWLHFLRQFGLGGCLADDMGLGKTIQALAMIASPERNGPALVVVPRSLVFNWKEEAARFAPQLRVLDLTGAGRKEQWKQIGDSDLVLSTYGTLRRDAPDLKDVKFDTVILDEAQTIKNAATESAKATRLLKADHRIALTGTPIENHVNDLWSLFEYLNPGMLGAAEVFRAHAAATEESLRILSQALRPFILRRTKEQVARELPAKTEQTIYCEMESGQRRLYTELRDHYRDSLLGRIDDVGIEKSRMQILEALLRLRQAACHPGLIDKAKTQEPSAKLDSLLPQIMEVVEGGHKAVVFSQFTSFLAIVRRFLDDEHITYEYLDGRTRDRQKRVDRFQTDPECRIFLISLKAGGLGLNLTAAEYVFLLDPWWNPAVEAQAIDRAHRIGQSRHVFAYRLIARDTIEEKVLELQKTKRELAGALITADNSVIAGLNREHLEMLLS
jgi:superfamily II DNA or RNA helicase